MFPFLSSAELALVQNDFVQMVNGEGSLITINYRTVLSPGGQPVIDPVYKNDLRVQNSIEQTTTAKGMMQIVHARNLVILGFGIVQEGDAIFYFLDNLNLLEPITGKPALESTVYFIDPFGGKWNPILNDVGPLQRYLAMSLNNKAISKVVPCVLRK